MTRTRLTHPASLSQLHHRIPCMMSNIPFHNEGLPASASCSFPKALTENPCSSSLPASSCSAFAASLFEFALLSSPSGLTIQHDSCDGLSRAFRHTRQLLASRGLTLRV